MCYSEMLERSLRGMHRSEAILCLHVLCELCCFISELLILCELTQTSTYVFKKEWLRIFFFSFNVLINRIIHMVAGAEFCLIHFESRLGIPMN